LFFYDVKAGVIFGNHCHIKGLMERYIFIVKLKARAYEPLSKTQECLSALSAGANENCHISIESSD
jgi:hypothetical protein